MQKKSQTAELVRIVATGEQLTTTQMAKRLSCSKQSVSSKLKELAQRHKIIIRPIGGKTGFSAKPKEGILTMIMENEDTFHEVNERNQKMTNGYISSQFVLLESAWSEYPDLRNSIEAHIEDFQIRYINEKKKLRKGDIKVSSSKLLTTEK